MEGHGRVRLWCEWTMDKVGTLKVHRLLNQWARCYVNLPPRHLFFNAILVDSTYDKRRVSYRNHHVGWKKGQLLRRNRLPPWIIDWAKAFFFSRVLDLIVTASLEENRDKIIHHEKVMLHICSNQDKLFMWLMKLGIYVGVYTYTKSLTSDMGSIQMHQTDEADNLNQVLYSCWFTLKDTLRSAFLATWTWDTPLQWYLFCVTQLRIQRHEPHHGVNISLMITNQRANSTLTVCGS